MRVNIIIEVRVKDDSFDLSDTLYDDLRNVVLDSLYKKDKFGEVKNISVTKDFRNYKEEV